MNTQEKVINDFIIDVLKMSETKISPEMVAAIAELIRANRGNQSCFLSSGKPPLFNSGSTEAWTTL